METTSEEQNKVKRMKRAQESLRHLWDFDIWPYQMHQQLNYMSPRWKGEKERVWESLFWKDYTWKFSQHGKGNRQSSTRGTESYIGQTQGETCQDTY